MVLGRVTGRVRRFASGVESGFEPTGNSEAAILSADEQAEALHYEAAH